MRNFEIAFVALFTHPFFLFGTVTFAIALTVLHFKERK